MLKKIFLGPGSRDVALAFQSFFLPLYLAKADIRQRYRRSTLGPFWITLSTGVMIACLGLIFGTLFKSPLKEFLPFLSAGLIIWGFISTTLSDATTVFATAEPIIKQLPIPLFTHILRMVARNFYIFLHNLIIFPIVLLCVANPLTINVLYVFPGLTILVANLLWMSLILGVVCARYRDLTQIVLSVLQIFFYITPIIWMPSSLPSRASLMLIEPNPFFHLIEIIRLPLMGQVPTPSNWMYSIFLTVIGWLLANLIFNKYRTRVAYWL